MKGNYESLAALAERVESMEHLKEDFRVSTDALEMDDGGEELIIRGVDDFHIQQNAHNQIAQRLNIPKAYYDRMQDVPGLRAQNVNAWLEHNHETRMVRTLEGNARAYLSDRYRPFDNYDFLTTALPVLEEFPGLQFKANALTDTRMYLQVVFPSMEKAVEVGDPVQWGVVFRNSEVGHSSIAIESLIWRLRCSNGMIGSSLMKKYHVGRSIGANENDYSVFANDTIRADVQSMRLQLRDILRASLTDDAFEKELLPMREAAGQEMSKPQTVVERVTKRFGLSESEGESVMNNLIRDGNSTRWGLANSITALAHDLESPDRQYDVERIGNEIITLKPSEWEKINAA